MEEAGPKNATNAVNATRSSLLERLRELDGGIFSSVLETHLKRCRFCSQAENCIAGITEVSEKREVSDQVVIELWEGKAPFCGQVFCQLCAFSSAQFLVVYKNLRNITIEVLGDIGWVMGCSTTDAH